MSTGKELSSRLAAMALAVLALVGAAAAEDGERRIQGVLAPSISNHDDDGDWYLFIYGAEEATQCQHRASPSEMQEILNLGPGVVTTLIEQADGSAVLWPVSSVRTQQAWQLVHELRNTRYFPTRDACLEEARWVVDKGADCYEGMKTDYDGRAACRAMFKDMDPGECKNIINGERRAACLAMVENSVSGRRRSGDLSADGWYMFDSTAMACVQTVSALALQEYVLKEEGYELQLLKADDGSVTFAPLKQKQPDGTSVEVRISNVTLFPTMDACQAKARQASNAAANLNPP